MVSKRFLPLEFGMGLFDFFRLAAFMISLAAAETLESSSDVERVASLSTCSNTGIWNYWLLSFGRLRKS